jgi:TetR/AcrR family transcriptional regulator, fatty acid metabolism regulator protein
LGITGKISSKSDECHFTGENMTNRPITKRQEQALETKERIYSAAIDLMDREGFENITIADISKKAGVSVGAFYHYFTSKNDIQQRYFTKQTNTFPHR